MAKRLSTQWEFGELFTKPEPKAEPATPARKVHTVTELTGTVKNLLERQVGQIWVTGEITNLRLQSSGHVYFTLKDAAAQLSCVLFRNEARAVSRDLLKDGQKVVLFGDITVYEARGQYQMIARQVELQGTGSLQIAFERLKQKLQSEGLFAQERKRPLPEYPQRIGIVTSSSGAALRDVLHVIQRRNPSLELVLSSCRVQGQGAGDEIACSIRMLNEWNEQVSDDPRRKLDLILVTRGGGSMEDLWAFNEESVARAIFESKLPVISAVGHEIDFTISDFVADVRAATPSVAAELITEGFFASREFVAEAPFRLSRAVQDRLESASEELRRLLQRLDRSHPRRRLQEQAQRLDDLQSSLFRCAKSSLRHYSTQWQSISQRLLRLRPSEALLRRREVLGQLEIRLKDNTKSQLKDLLARLSNAQSRLRLLSPTNVLERGYSITTDAETGKIISDAKDVQPGQKVRTRLKSGEFDSTVDPQ